MKPKDAEYVLAVAKHRSFTKAAQELYIAQSSLSRYINALEARHGVELFDRTTVPLGLTLAGKRFVSYAKEFLLLSDKMRTEFHNIKGQQAGKLCFGVPTEIGAYILPKFLPVFVDQYPAIEVQISGGTTKELSLMLTTNTVDISVLTKPKLGSEFKNDLVARERILLVGSPCHPLLHQVSAVNEYGLGLAAIDLKTIVQEQFFTTSSFWDSHIRSISRQTLSASAPNIVRVPNLNAALTLVGCGMGFTFAMESMLKYQPVKDPLTLCIIDGFEELMSIILSYRVQYYSNNEMVRSFIKCFHDCF